MLYLPHHGIGRHSLLSRASFVGSLDFPLSAAHWVLEECVAVELLSHLEAIWAVPIEGVLWSFLLSLLLVVCLVNTYFEAERIFRVIIKVRDILRGKIQAEILRWIFVPWRWSHWLTHALHLEIVRALIRVSLVEKVYSWSTSTLRTLHLCLLRWKITVIQVLSLIRFFLSTRRSLIILKEFWT